MKSQVSASFVVIGIALFTSMSFAQGDAKTQTIRRETPSFKITVPADWEPQQSSNSNNVLFYAAPRDAEGRTPGNVSIVHKQLQNPVNVKAAYEKLKKELEGAKNITLVDSGLRDCGNLKGCFFLQERRANDQQFRILTVVGYADRDQFLITFTSSTEQYAAMQAIFETIVSSFSSPAGSE